MNSITFVGTYQLFLFATLRNDVFSIQYENYYMQINTNSCTSFIIFINTKAIVNY